MPSPMQVYYKGKLVSETNRLPVNADIVLGDTVINTTGLATEDKQDTTLTQLNDMEADVEAGNALLTTIDADTGAIATSVAAVNTKTPALGQALAAASSPVVLPQAQVDALVQASTFDTRVGLTNETAPVSDTAPAGLNSRLQRIAQRISSLIALLPTALTGAGSLKTAVMEALPAGDNNIGNVDIVSSPDSRDSWRVSTQSFTAADDSDNTFTVPATTEWQIQSIYVQYISTGSGAARQLVVDMQDASGNLIGRIVPGITQTTTQTRHYFFAPGLPQDIAARDVSGDYVAVAMPPIILAAGQKLRVYDKQAIAAAADDMTVRMQIASRSVT